MRNKMRVGNKHHQVQWYNRWKAQRFGSEFSSIIHENAIVKWIHWQKVVQMPSLYATQHRPHETK